MAFCGVCVPSSNHHYLLSPITSISPSRKPAPPLTPSLSSSASSSSSCVAEPELRGRLPSTVGKRSINISFMGFMLSKFLFISKDVAVADPVLELDRYTDPKEGFTLLVPSSWIKVDKAGATVLFEDANEKANNVGVVVAPTRISNLGEFGTPQFVVDKLIQAEKRKVCRFQLFLLIIMFVLLVLLFAVVMNQNEVLILQNPME